MAAGSGHVGDLGRGVTLLWRGQKWALRHPRDWLFGMVPALISFAGYVVALVALVIWSDDLVAWATPFADHWAAAWRDLFRDLTVAVVVGGGLLLAVVSFTAVTLLVGQPFYEALAGRVDESQGGAPAPLERPLWQELWIGLRDSVRLLVRVAAFAVVLFVAGFLPGIGQTVVPVVGFCVSGFFLTQELASVSMQRRGVGLREQLRLMRGRLALVLGFGVPLVLAFLVPFVAVLLMPGAVAGATLLTRELLPPTAPVVPGAPGRA
ncbi:EI24 domain-containing protein [Streptomyces sp. IBSBF 2435]|uniref:EI24 domain-containing protein n=1 Tax=Streptomyces sp. IBSBF 2435 TaxID=2903531 RepID=UPI002FDC10EE